MFFTLIFCSTRFFSVVIFLYKTFSYSITSKISDINVFFIVYRFICNLSMYFKINRCSFIFMLCCYWRSFSFNIISKGKTTLWKWSCF
uniref:NADH dehydrogenase subunit 4L n=1 Tax=Cornu aspersum TaxID=6535 RepID=S4SA79_CORAP|nr:NADH dehydrogenase subunit 4L [Cornu aspersum]